MKLFKALNLKNKELVCFVGAGGKSSLMGLLARECVKAGAKVLVTTTTQMYYHQLKKCSPLVVLQQADNLLPMLNKHAESNKILAAASTLLDNQKVIGLNKELLDHIHSSGMFDYILVEADGARGKSIKVPSEHEPVLPSLTTTVLPVIGLDVLGCPLDGGHVHRSHLFSQAVGQREGEPVTEKTIIKMFLYYERVVRKTNPNVNWVPILNKLDYLADKNEATRIAIQMISLSTQQVLLTSTSSSQPVLEVVK